MLYSLVFHAEFTPTRALILVLGAAGDDMKILAVFFPLLWPHYN